MPTIRFAIPLVRLLCRILSANQSKLGAELRESKNSVFFSKQYDYI